MPREKDPTMPKFRTRFWQQLFEISLVTAAATKKTKSTSTNHNFRARSSVLLILPLSFPPHPGRTGRDRTGTLWFCKCLKVLPAQVIMSSLLVRYQFSSMPKQLEAAGTCWTPPFCNPAKILGKAVLLYVFFTEIEDVSIGYSMIPHDISLIYH